MALNDIAWQNTDAKEYLRELGGSKSGAYSYVADNLPHLRKHLPTETKHLAAGGDIGTFLEKMNFDTPKVVRGCHRLDVCGMVDVIPTYVDVKGREEVRRSIEGILRMSRDADIRSFVEYESGEPFDGAIDILVQNYCGGERGSILEHPHEKGIYHVDRASPSATSYVEKSEEICDEQGRAIDTQKHPFNRKEKPLKEVRHRSIPQPELERIVRLYKDIQLSGLMPHTHSFQMEYGVHQRTNEIMFYQSRLFKPYIESANFEPQRMDRFSVVSHYYDAYGITHKEGVEMPMAELGSDFVEKYMSADAAAYSYNASGSSESIGLGIQPKNLAAYFPYQRDVLSHGHFRWLQKSPLSIAGVRRLMDQDRAMRHMGTSLQDIEDEIRVRICSNGITGVAALMKD